VRWVGWEVDGTRSGSRPVVGIGVNIVGLLGSTVMVLHNLFVRCTYYFL
jgi:hypothetical protein